jgi:ribosomal protein L37AE/L43A
MPEDKSLSMDMCLRMSCHFCGKRRLCKSAAPYLWACKECKPKHARDKDACKYPELCWCIACLDGG